MITHSEGSRIATFIQEQAESFCENPLHRPADPFWTALTSCGTELWLDTGDLDGASELWSGDFSGLTTNNTLLNKEIQKGIYDELVKRSRPIVAALTPEQQIREVSFILNAVHGLRLVRQFGAWVSVELHTAVAHDIEATCDHARRFAALSPDFIIKIPLTPSGLIATRRIRQAGIPVNFTLGFGARQNAIAARFAEPDYVNVFLGRLNTYVETHRLPNADDLGERATWASQDFLRGIDRRTRQIAASLRSADQLERLAGVDVFTIPVVVAADALEQLDGKWEGGMPEAAIEDAETAIAKTYRIEEKELQFADALCADPPETGDELVARAHDAGVGDLFPRMTSEELAIIAADGKIPDHAKWAPRMARGELALDALLNLAGLASFARDQQALDDRIASLL